MLLISEKEKEERFIDFIASLIVKITFQQVGLNPDEGSIPLRSVEANATKKEKERMKCIKINHLKNLKQVWKEKIKKRISDTKVS
ncbi:MAG: hypothetical protein J0I41_12310 [Filimonas sp.]|nr:hypothetical protein [Filimonas sp.]